MATKKRAARRTPKQPPAMLVQMVPVEQLREDPANAKKHGDRNIGAIRHSLRTFGQRKPLVVRKQTMTVMAGNGTLRAAVAEGWPKVACVLVAESSARARAFALADNRTSELGEWDYERLAEQLPELKDATLLGWSEDELKAINLDATWEGAHDAAPATPQAQKPVRLVVEVVDKQYNEHVRAAVAECVANLQGKAKLA